MWKLFKRKRKVEEIGPAHDQLAEYIAVRIIRRQRQLADWLQLKSERLSVRTKKALFVVFFMLATGYFLDLIFLAKPKSLFPHRLGHFVAPRLQPDNPLAKVDTSDSISLGRVKKFKRFLDSLNATTEGKEKAARLLRGRKGLVDSLDNLLK